MTKVSLEENRFHWTFTSFTVICMVSTFALGWSLLQEFVSEQLQSRDKDALYDDIMRIGTIVLIFHMSKFYLLLCFRKKIEMVDFVDSEEGENLKKECNGGEEDCKDDAEIQDQDQNTEGVRFQEDRAAEENRADIDIDVQQNLVQNSSESQGCQNLEDEGEGTNRQENVRQDYEGVVEKDLALVDTKVNTNQNIQPQRNTWSRKKALSLSEGGGSSRSQSERNIEGRRLLRSSISREAPRKSKSVSSIEKKPSLYNLRHRSCFH